MQILLHFYIHTIADISYQESKTKKRTLKNTKHQTEPPKKTRGKAGKIKENDLKAAILTRMFKNR